MTIAWSGCWEERPDRIICRWMLAWDQMKGSLAGCVAGYSGGGAFQCEKFLGKPGNLVIDCYSDLSSLGGFELVDLSEDCQTVILQLHDDNLWLESDTLILRDVSLLPNVLAEKDLIYSGERDVPAWAKPLFDCVGLISQPKTFVLREEK